MSRQLRSWFFTTSGDFQRYIAGIPYYQRFLGGGDSIPTQQTMQNLCDSVGFHGESNSAASVDSIAALINKQGFVIIAADVNAKAGSDTPLGATAGTLAVAPHQLPTVNPDSNQSIGAFTGQPITVTVDPTVATRNNFLLKLTPAFNTWLLGVIVPTGGTTGQILAKSSNTDNAVQWIDVSSSGGFPTYDVVADTTNNSGGDFTGADISVASTTSGSATTFTLKLSTGFYTWLNAVITVLTNGINSLNSAISGNLLPSQTGANGKFLTTNGTTASWANVPSGSSSTGGSFNQPVSGAGTWTIFYQRITQSDGTEILVLSYSCQFSATTTFTTVSVDITSALGGGSINTSNNQTAVGSLVDNTSGGPFGTAGNVYYPLIVAPNSATSIEVTFSANATSGHNYYVIGQAVLVLN